MTSAIYLVCAGFIVAVPEWSLPESPDWSLSDMRHALFPYVVMIAIGVTVFGLTRLAARVTVSRSKDS